MNTKSVAFIKNTLFLILLCPVLVSGVNVTFNVDMSQEDVGGEGPTLWMGFFWPEAGFVMTDDDQDEVWSYTVDNLVPGTYTYKYRNGWWTDWDIGSGWEDISGQDCAVGEWSDREVVVGAADMVVDACFGFCIDGFCGIVETDCSDGIDNDGDGFTDCDDSNCVNDLDCLEDYTGLLNPSFEDSLTGWAVSNGGNSQPASIGSGDAHTGEQYLILGVASAGWAVAYQDNILANGGETWIFSSYIKDVTEGGAGGDFSALKVEFYDESNNQTFIETIQVGVTDEWNMFLVSHVLPENTVKVTAVLVATRGDGGGDAHYGFDDVLFYNEETASVTVNHEIPSGYSLSQNYPNPFNPETSISYEIPKESFLTISVYNLLGHKVVDLVSDMQPVGYHNIMWNSTDMSGKSVSSGVYIYTITAGDYRAVKKMILIK